MLPFIRRDSALNTVSIAAVESCSDDIAAIHSAQRDATTGTALADPFSSLHRIEETDAYGFSLLSTSTELHRKRQVTITRFRFGRPSVLNEVKTEHETSDFYGMTGSLAFRLAQLSSHYDGHMEWGFRVVVQSNISNDMGFVSASVGEDDHVGTYGLAGVHRTEDIDNLVERVRDSVESRLVDMGGSNPSDAWFQPEHVVLSNQYEISMIPARLGGANDNLTLKTFSK